MEKSIKTLTRLSLILQKCSLVSSNLSVQRLTHHIPQQTVGTYAVTNERKNTVKRFNYNEETESTELKINNLLHDLESNEKLECCPNSLFVLHQVATLYRQIRHSSQSQDIINHKGFARLCDELMKDSMNMTSDNIVRCLRNLVDLNVPINSIIIQKILQLLRPCINDLRLKTSVSLFRLLEQNTHTNLSKALYEGLKVILNDRMTTNLTTQSSTELCLCLQEARRNDMEGIYRIIYKIWQLKEIDRTSIAPIFFELCKMFMRTDHTPTYWKLISRLQCELARELATSVTETSFAWAEYKLIYYITNKYSNKFTQIYNADLIRAIVNKAMTQRLPFKDSASIAVFLYKIGQPDLAFLEFLAIQLCEEINQKSTMHEEYLSNAIIQFVQSLAASNYKPFLWETIQHHVMELKNMEFSTKQLVNLCNGLMILESDCTPFLEKLFDRSDDIENLSNRYKNRLLMTYCGIKSSGTKYTGSLANDSIMKFADELYVHRLRRNNAYCKTILAKALGGEQFLYCSLRTKVGQFINYAVVIGKDGYPIPVCKFKNQSITYVEDIQKSLNDKIVLIIQIPPLNSEQRLNGYWSSILRFIEAYTGYDAITLNTDVFRYSNNVLQKQFIMQAIRLKCGCLHETQVNTEIEEL